MSLVNRNLTDARLETISHNSQNDAIISQNKTPNLLPIDGSKKAHDHRYEIRP